MLKTKPVQIDGQLYQTPAAATVADVVPWNLQSITTTSGALIPREQFARMPVPEGFDTNLSSINKGDGIEAQYRAPEGNSTSHRFAAGRLWYWAIVTAKLLGLAGLLAASITLTVETGQLLLLDDGGFHTATIAAFYGLTGLRSVLLGSVIAGTALAIVAAADIRELWQQTFGALPFVACTQARLKYSLRLFATIILAAAGGLVVCDLLPAVLHGDRSVMLVFFIGLLFLGSAIYSLVRWLRQLG